MTTSGKLVLAFGLVTLMAAPASAQGPGGRGGFGGGGGAMLLSNKSVQQELKVTDEQAKKLDTLAEETRSKGRESMEKLRDLPEAERREKGQELRTASAADLHKSLAEVLKPEQVKRFRQIELQQAGPNAFAMPRVQEALKLTDDQKSQIRTINEGLYSSNRTNREALTSGGGDRQAAMQKMAEQRKQAAEKAMAVLTDSQKSTWKDLTGEPFEVKYERRAQN